MSVIPYKVLKIRADIIHNYYDNDQPIFYPFDFMSLVYAPAGVTVYVKIDDINADEINLNKVGTIQNPRGHYTLFYLRTEGTANDYIVIYLGGDSYFQTQSFTITSDLVGLAKESTVSQLAKDSTLTQTRTLSFINVNVGTTPTQIVTTSTLISMLMIQNNSTSDVYLGSSTNQPIKISANGGVFTLTLPLSQKIDLSTLYLISSVSVTVAVMYA
jgi:hypothetical protein